MNRAQVEALTGAVALFLVLCLSSALAVRPSWPVATALVAFVALVLGLRALADREDRRIALRADEKASSALVQIEEVRKTAARAFEAVTQPRRAGPPHL